MSKKKKNQSVVKDDADDPFRSSSASTVTSSHNASQEESSRYLLLFLFLLGFILPFFYYYFQSSFTHGGIHDHYGNSVKGAHFHPSLATHSHREFVMNNVGGNTDPYMIHMTKSTTASDKNTDSSATSKSRINSSTYGGMNYPSYKYYYYDVYSQSFRLYPQPWDTEDERDTSVSTASSIEWIHDRISAHTSSTGGRNTKYPPLRCEDGQTIGYSDWTTLRNAIHERNDEYQKFYSRWSWFQNAWSEYEMIQFLHPVPPTKSMNHHSGHGTSSYSSRWIEPPPRPIESHTEKNHHWQGIGQGMTKGPNTKSFVICPGAHLKTPRSSGKMSIFINSESFQMECDGCIFDGGGTHLTFGPQAKNVWIKGITFTGATTSSVVFPHSGAEVNFLRCNWFNNRGVGSNGATLDVISTSTTVQMYGCSTSEISDGREHSMTLTIRPPVNSL